VTSLADVIVVYLELGKLFGTFLRRRDAKRLLFVVVEVAGVAGIAMDLCSSVSVCHKSVFYRNG